MKMSQQNVRVLQIATAAIEIGAGFALFVSPSFTAEFLLGQKLESLVDLAMARFSGAGLLTLGIVCWMARSQPHNSIWLGLVVAMLFYYIALAGVLAFAGLDLGLHGSGLWPIIVLHAAMGVWCAITISRGRQPPPFNLPI
jgi:hypothetical protein